MKTHRRVRAKTKIILFLIKMGKVWLYLHFLYLDISLWGLDTLEHVSCSF